MDNTIYKGYTPIEFLNAYPDVCDFYDCYLWNDSTRNWKVDDGELKPFSFDVDHVTEWPSGIKNSENGRYMYCAGETTNGEEFYCLQPTYWQKGKLL